MKNFKHTLAFGGGLMLCAYFSVAAAQAQAQALVDAQAPVLTYKSVFADYALHKEVLLRDWKASNEAVRAAGGWREYLKEAQSTEASPSADTPMNKPANTGAHSHPSEVKKP